MSNNGTRARILGLLRRFKWGMTKAQLADVLSVRRPGLGDVVMALVADGRVKRATDASESRYVLCGAVPPKGEVMANKPNKVKVSIKADAGDRSYTGDYGFVAVVNMDAAVECRWVQEPARWEKGLGLFVVGVEALKVVAEQKGDAAFQAAARAALDAMRKFEPKENKQ